MSPLAPQALAADALRRFLKALAQGTRLIALYKAGHPVPTEALREALRALEALFASTGWSEASLGRVDGRWQLNEVSLADKTEGLELLEAAFRAHGLGSVTFEPGLHLFELSAFCELAATTPANAQADPQEFVKRRGARRLRLDVESFVRGSLAKTAPAAPRPAVPSPIPAPAPLSPHPESAGAPPSAGWGFGGFIKSLVESAVQDPGERAKIYVDAVKNVKEALARHVERAAAPILREKTKAVNQGQRTEHVLTALADGRVTVDREGRVLMMDPKAEEILGNPLSSVAGRPLMDSLTSDDRVIALAKDLELPESGEVSGEVRTAGPAEVLDALRRSLALVQDEEGRTVGTYAVMPHAAKFREMMHLQDEFLASVTHELKAPLSSICSALEVISDKARVKLSPDEAEFLDISLRNSHALSDLIQELLDFSKLRSGKMTVRPASSPVEPMLKEAVLGLGPWAQSKKVSLLIDPRCRPAGLPRVLADRARVVQILNNLLSNSIKHTEEGGRVRVGAVQGRGRQAGTVVLSVKDDGCGIAEEDRRRIFDKFTQLESGIKRGGVGLGLSIARDLVALHQGELWLDSKVAKGTTFYFTLPVARASEG